MKMIIAILMVLCLCACGEPEAPQTTSAPATEETVYVTEPILTPEGHYVYSYTWMDGTVVTKHRIGSKSGTLVREKYVHTDGSGYENLYDDQGVLYRHSETIVNSKLIQINHWDPNDWLEGFEEHYYDGSVLIHWYQKSEDGQRLRKSIREDADTGEKYHWEYYDDGTVKYQFVQTKDHTEEIKRDEEGYCMYYYFSGADGYNVECVADETGKLVKCTIMGMESTDYASFAAQYNFRSW